MECLAHVAEFVQRTNSITVGVWDALYRLGGRLSERNGGVHALDERDVQLLPRPFDLGAFVLALVDAALQQSEKQPRHRRRHTQKRRKLRDVDVQYLSPR